MTIWGFAEKRTCPKIDQETRMASLAYQFREVLTESAEAFRSFDEEHIDLSEQLLSSLMFEEIVGSSSAICCVTAHVMRVAQSDATVLITGESGTGKELIARAIHKRSRRSRAAFTRMNCAATPSSLVAAELFGYEKGAFTGANQRHAGRFEVANHGTIFLDEMGDMPGEAQVALLRVLQEREFERVGGTQSIPIDVRVIAATNCDLPSAVRSGKFRLDLFYRLNVFPIHVPPLRDRPEDILLLAKYFIERYAAKAGKRIRRVKKRTAKLLEAYDWPGNIRELQNVIERAMILCDSDTFSVEESWLRPESDSDAGFRLSLSNHQRGIIEAALAKTRGRVAGPQGAAAKLGIPRTTLESQIKSLHIDKNRYRSGDGASLSAAACV
jgi:formate hydrogenlyase transcriptional activator